MYLPQIALHEASTLDDAAAAMTRYSPRARLLAGGTDVLVDLKSGRINIDHLVSINRIDALRGLSITENGLSIGALTPVGRLEQSPFVSGCFSPILDAARKMASPQIRNVATVGGNIAGAVPCADLPPILIAMGALVKLWSPSGERKIALDDVVLDVRKTALRDDELLTKVLVPTPPPRFGAAYVRFGLRDGNTIAVAAVAAALTLGDDHEIQHARVVLGAVAPIPKVVEPAADILRGQTPEDEVFRHVAVLARDAAQPISDVRGSADFRRELVEILTRRALAAACQRAQEAS
jgi:carbon-monoxide dehydrogenase medium subunit